MVQYIYLHGFASGPSSRKARFLASRFAGLGIDLAVPDLASEGFERLTMSGQEAVLHNMAGGRRSVLIGSSLGGYLAAQYASRHPEVERMVLLAPAFDFGARWLDRMGPDDLDAWRRDGSYPFFHYAAGRELPLHYGFIESCAGWEPYPPCAQPALVIHGANDDVVPVSVAREWASRQPRARLDILDSDHELGDVLPEIWNKIEEFCGLGTAAGQSLG